MYPPQLWYPRVSLLDFSITINLQTINSALPKHGREHPQSKHTVKGQYKGILFSPLFGYKSHSGLVYD